MLSSYPPAKIKALRKRAMLSQMQVVELTGVTETTLKNWESGRRRPQTEKLEKVLNLYAIKIQKLEHYDQIWGTDGLQRPTPKNGVASGNGTHRSGDRPKQPPEAKSRSLPSHAQRSAQSAWKSRTA
jgi:transcriptional regulator with XRE-family HTH domain